MKWISVKDRLPNVLQQVKAKIKGSDTSEDMIFCQTEKDNHFCYKDGTETIREVTNWMPIN